MRTKIKELHQHHLADTIAAKYGISRRSVYRAAEFYQAIQILMRHYGDDMRECILDRKVKLTHAELVRLAGAVDADPHAFCYVGEIIRAGNTKLLRSLLRGGTV